MPPIERRHELSGRWTNPDVFTEYNEERSLFRPATREVVADVLDRHVSPSGRIVEVGSGLGEFVHNILPANSPLRNRIIQTEQSQPFMRENRRLHPTIDGETPLVGADVYALPFPDNSVDTVIGFASFDTFADPDNAMREIQRVLRPGGRMIHFLDLEACPNVIFHNLDPQVDNRVPLPTLDLEAKASGVMMIPRKNVEWARDHGEEYYQGAFRMLLRATPADIDSQRNYLEKLNLQSLLNTKGAEMIYYNDYFYTNMRNALKAAGLTIEAFGLQEASIDMKRQDISDIWTKPLKGNNHLISHTGTVYGKNNESITKYFEADTVRTTSQVHVIVAQKPVA